ncbi:hypothetical protein TNCV_1419001 [Trichonephila clavipes]|nr:hypothetical protein TNCV_1419001 [Trichonephila clavipes]
MTSSQDRFQAGRMNRLVQICRKYLSVARELKKNDLSGGTNSIRLKELNAIPLPIMVQHIPPSPPPSRLLSSCHGHVKCVDRAI